ncbi:MAG TPA: PKD domain-containing protein [Desulfobacteria bacterium]|nr:PKD domain-containing protein [Desulfobacteria bacterium]
MNTKKNIIGITLALIMIASIFTVLPVASQPPGPPEGNEGIGNVSLYKATLRVYGELDEGPAVTVYDSQGQFVYPNYADAFDPTALQKDVLVFNPAIVKDGEYDAMFANTSDGNRDIDVKKYLRLWYEPHHYYSSTDYHYPTIEVETTYMLVDAVNIMPVSGRNNSQFVFPIAEKLNQTGLGSFANDVGIETYLATNNTVKLVDVTSEDLTVSFNKTTSGTIQIEKGYSMAPDDKVQFLDHKLQYLYTVTHPVTGNTFAKVRMSYAGNVEDDTFVGCLLGRYDNGAADDPDGNTWFDRHNVRYNTYSHPERTWYARFDAFGGGFAQIVVGKRITAGDTFYVNGVRYDVPAIEVIDTSGDTVGDAFKYITLRTPLPKDTDGTRSFIDDKIVSSQWLDAIAPEETIPLNPPFNADHYIVDDINVVLWEPDTYPLTGLEERYLTMPNPPSGLGWTPMDPDNDGNWILNDTEERISPSKVEPLVFAYIEEAVEPRFDTELYEILLENFSTPPPVDSWTHFDIETEPDHYTAFALPTLWDVPTPPVNKSGDYLLVSSFYAPNSMGLSEMNRSSEMPRVAFAYDVEPEDDVLGTDTLMGDEMDIYVNSYGDYYSRLRIYGEDDRGPVNAYTLGNGSWIYSNYQYPFNPAALRKDSITFNPAIVERSADYPIVSDGLNAAVKKFLRIWYEPAHNFSDDKTPTGPEATIEVESTYMLVDNVDFDPLPGGVLKGTFFVFPIASNFTTAPAGLDLFENPTSDPMRENVVTLSYVNGSVLTNNKTLNGTIRIEKTYTLDEGEEIQFMDFKLKYNWYTEDPVLHYKNASVVLTYVGNNESGSGGSWTPAGATIEPTEKFFDMHYVEASTPDHPYRTWYARYEADIPGYNKSMITVGKELQAGDIFYVEGIRYDVSAIEVKDTNGDTFSDKFTYITIRTPLPKGTGDFEEDLPTSQWVDRWPNKTILPLNPPFCGTHAIVDDIDAGDEDDYTVRERILEGIPALEIFYIAEVIEPRYSTNLLQILNETLYLGSDEPDEDWTQYDVRTLPDQFTEFVLPGDNARWDFNESEWKSGSSTLHNDYLVTTSFLAPNAEYSLADITYPDEFRVAFVYDVFNMEGIYINEIDETPPTITGLDPTVNINVTPDTPTNVTGCQDVTVCTDGTTDDQMSQGLEIWVTWGDGETAPTQIMSDAGSPVCFTHSYLLNGPYTITVTARDIYGNTGTKTHTVNVSSDCCRLVLSNGWNQFSANVNTTDNVSTIFDPMDYDWVDVVWTWDEALQSWDTLGPSDTLDPKRGYFIYCPLPDGDVVELVGTAAPFDDAWMTPGFNRWYLFGVGYSDQTVSYKSYWWNGFGYVGTYDLKQTRGYWRMVV